MGRESRIDQHRRRDVGNVERDGRRDDVREQSAPDVEAFQLVQVVIRPDRSELENLIEGCFGACGLGVVEHVGHDYLPWINPVESITFPAPPGARALNRPEFVRGLIHVTPAVMAGASCVREYSCLYSAGGRSPMGIVTLVRAARSCPVKSFVPDRSQQAHVTASHSTTARVFAS